jgi:hypothetical protein
MSPGAPHEGGCMCAAVRYQVTGPLRDVVGCHCSQCRRMTGHFMAASAARLADFSVLCDATLRWYEASADARRGFCATCGSTLFWSGRGLDYISIAAGSLDDARGLKFACHIFVADKGAYYEIEPGVPQIKDGRFSLPILPA